MEKLLLTESDAAENLGVTLRNLREMRYRGKGPAYVQVSPRNVRYRVEDLERYASDALKQPEAATA